MPKYTPKGKIVAITSTQPGILKFDDRLDNITMINLGGININVIFDDATINPIPIAPSAALDFSPWDLRNCDVRQISFTATGSINVNCLWIEGPSIMENFAVIWRKR